MKLNEGRFPRSASDWLKGASRCGAATRDGAGKAWRVGYRNEFPTKGFVGDSDLMFLAHHGFIKLGVDGQIMVRDINDDDEGMGE